MSDRLQLTDDDAIQLLRSLSLVHEPITVQKSAEGGEHIVWVVNDELILRVPLFQNADPEGLAREKRVTDFLIQNMGGAAVARAVPKVLTVGLGHGGGKAWRYAVYQMAKGISIEDKPDAVTPTTEEDLAYFLRSLSAISLDQATDLGVTRADTPAVDELAAHARDAWDRLTRSDMMPTLIGKSRDELLRQPTEQELRDDEDPWVFSHHDLKGEHIFIDPATSRLTSVIDWSDMRWAHPGVDIWGLAITIGAVGAVRVARLAVRSPSSIRVGLFLARCDIVMILDAVVAGQSDAPEWLVRRQLERAMEWVEL